MNHARSVWTPGHLLPLLCLVAIVCLSSSTLPAQSWNNPALPAGQRAALLLAEMAFNEKIDLINGAGGPYVGNVPANSRLGIPALTLQDGPAGVRVSDASTTALPAPIALAAGWDPELARQYGATMGAEARGKGVEVLLGPMMNLARAYQAGRNFEGNGEDPFLAAAIASAEIQGMQSRGVIATAKHFVGNEQENLRMLISSDVDERTLQEIYYPPFLASVRAGAGAAMASYNRVNLRYACESESLNATLKKLWGFNGFVMSDWGAGFSTAAGINHGLDMEMYSGGHFKSTPVSTEIQLGNVPASAVDGIAQRILTTLFRFGMFDNPPSGNLNSTVRSPEHDQFARDAAAAGTVLLKNSGGLLPLDSSVRSIAVIGSAASVSPISTGGGSASVNLPYNVTPLAGITSRAGGVTVGYAQGDGASLSQAVHLATNSDVAIVCVGQRTSEGSDRSSLSLSADQESLVSAVAAANPRTIVVVYSSSATLMPWANAAAAILMAWYPGQENGNALARVVFGDVNPSGKLPVTIPAAAGQVPTSRTAQFPGVSGHVSYSEGLQVGYRWYDANGVAPLFPFGCGMSYTAFSYSNLTVSAVSPSGQVRIGFDLRNTGARAGAEVAQLYLGFPAAAGEPPQLLKGFQKVLLSPGQTQHVSFALTWEDMAHWDSAARGWIVTHGTFHVSVGASSRDIRLSGSFDINSPIPSSDLANAALQRPATVSSSASAATAGSAAVDGDTTSAWVSLAGDPQWISLDLGVTRDLSRVRLHWNTNHATSYQIQISNDNTNWTGIFITNGATGGVEEILVSGRGRYIRVHGTQHAGAGGYALSEFDVFSQPQRPRGGGVPALPARLQAEDYDDGGQDVAYHKTTAANPGGVYRPDDVGIEPCSDAGGGWNVTSINSGDWLEYTVNPPNASAIYRISARVAAPAVGGQLRVRLDGTVLGTVNVPNTGGPQSWQTIVLPSVPIAGGASKALRVEALVGGFNLNWIELERVQICGTNDIARHRPATASSTESATYPASNAFDGDPTTRWSSAFSDPQWIQVDLGSVQDIARVRLDWENAFARNYSLQLSADAVTWSNAATVTGSPGSISDLAVLGRGRYVRMHATQRSTAYGDSLWDFEVYPPPQPASISDLDPAPGSVFADPSGHFRFTVGSADASIATNDVQLILNGIDVSSFLVFGGSPMNRAVTFPGLQPNGVYSLTINVTNADGQVITTTLNNAFDTFSQSNLIVEAEDFDFGSGQFIDEPVPSSSPASNSYFLRSTPAVWGIDLTTPNNIDGEQFAYRNDSCGTQVAADFLRQKFITAGASDYNVGWWYSGAWLNYTRTFPAKSYYVLGRLAGGNGAYTATNSLVTEGRGTASQTTSVLGTFSGLGNGWQAWQWAPLTSASGRPAVVPLSGVQTLKMTSGNNLNANFYMLLPVPPLIALGASLSNYNPVVSFPTETGFSYMLVYKNELTDAHWKLLNIVPGDGATHSLGDTISGLSRFYRVVVQ